MSRVSLWVHAMAGLMLATGAACTARIGQPGESGDSTAEPDPTPPRQTPGKGGAGGSNVGGAGGVSALPPSMCKGGIDPGPSLARRLTRWEYKNTIKDLLGPSDATANLSDAFPVEEHVLGFDNNAAASTVSPLLSESYMDAAERLATEIVDTKLNAQLLGNCDPAVRGDMCLDSFFNGFAKRAYRRPLTPEEIQVLREVFEVGRTAPGNFANGVKLMLMAVLQSPQFLYRVEVGMPAKPGDTVVRLTPYEVATRLSYHLWGTMPDNTLLTAADQNKLGTPAEVKVQVDRMLSMTTGTAPNTMVVPNSKAERTVERFHAQWLELEKLLEVEKDTKEYPKAANKTYLTYYHNETTAYLKEIFWSGGSFEHLMTAPFTYGTNASATFYKDIPVPAAPAEGAAKLEKIMLQGTKRGGLLTQGAFMTLFANANQTSPVLRGKFVREQLLCQVLPPPPNDVMIVLPPLDKSQTTRARFSKHATDPACAGCHSLMDPIGLGFENFDAIGLWRDSEAGQAIDASGEVMGMTNGKFHGAVELGKKLTENPQARDCVVRQWFRYSFGRPEQPDVDDCSLDQARKRFADSGYKLRDLWVSFTETDAFLYKRVDQGAK